MSVVENDGTRMVAALEAAGFTVVGGRAGMYVRLAWPDAHPRANTLRVPVGDGFADFADSLADVVAELEYAAGRGEAARRALDLHRTEAKR